MEDNTIVELYLKRDEAALRETSKKYGRYLETIAANHLSDERDREECVSDTYLRAWNTIPPEKPKLLKAFLAALTRSLAIDRLRRMSAVKRKGQVGTTALDELEECLTDDDTPEAAFERKRLTELIERWLDGQTKECRTAFVRRYWYLDPVKEIAADLGAGEGKVKSMLFRARKSLAEELVREGSDFAPEEMTKGKGHEEN